MYFKNKDGKTKYLIPIVSVKIVEIFTRMYQNTLSLLQVRKERTKEKKKKKPPNIEHIFKSCLIIESKFTTHLPGTYHLS